MEVQDHPDQDESLVKRIVRAEPGKQYPVRILHFVNGLMIIGFVIEVFPETTMVLRPHSLDVNFNEHSENVEGYDFEPYLNQIAHYDPSDLTPVAFMNSSLVALVRPADHVIKNYVGLVQIKETVHHADDSDTIEIMYRREIPRASSLH